MGMCGDVTDKQRDALAPHRPQPAAPARAHQRRAELRELEAGASAATTMTGVRGGRRARRWSDDRAAAARRRGSPTTCRALPHRAVPRRPGQAAADPPQPALERDQVHARGRAHHACVRRTRTAGTTSVLVPCATPASASRPSATGAIFDPFVQVTGRSTAARGRRTRAWRSAATSRAAWAATLEVGARWAGAPPSRCGYSGWRDARRSVRQRMGHRDAEPVRRLHAALHEQRGRSAPR